MTRRIFDFVIILLFVWGGMLFGLWTISSMIVPMSIPGVSRYLVNILQVVISSNGTSLAADLEMAREEYVLEGDEKQPE